MNNYIYKKEVDWSSLNYGIAIPYRMHDIFTTTLTKKIKRGEGKDIKILIGTQEYCAKLQNYNVDNNKRPKAKDMVHISYYVKSPLVKHLQEYFHDVFTYLSIEKEKQTNKKNHIHIPDELLSYIYIYETDVEDTYIFDCVNHLEVEREHRDTKSFDEFDLEHLLNHENGDNDKDSDISKIRKLDITISRQLKEVYDYSCQICGEQAGRYYGLKIAEAHHLRPFSLTLNSSPENIIILCPNHHKVIHRAKPQYDFEKKLFLFSNDYSEGLRLNKHL